MGSARATESLRRILNIELPIVQAPMAGVQGSALAAAVSNAGGLGSLPCAILDVDAMRVELTKLGSATAAPFNVNFSATGRRGSMRNARRAGVWRCAVLQGAWLRADPAPAEAGRIAFNSAAADVVAEFKPRVVSFHFGLPSAELVARVKDWGAKVLSSATTVDEALWLEAHGVDAIVAQGR